MLHRIRLAMQNKSTPCMGSNGSVTPTNPQIARAA
jgi:hypothetical protein